MIMLRCEKLPKAEFNFLLLIFVLTSLSVVSADASDFYVSPQGSRIGKGTFNSPWDLQTALDQPHKVKPGDTIWLCGGTYKGAYVSHLQGNSTAPIIVRNCPGERAILDRGGSDPKVQPALTVNGSRVWFWGLEITNSNTNRSQASPFTGNVRPWRGDGIDVYGPNNKFINVIFHDNGSGIYDKQDGTEIYGCLFFFNGNNKFEHGLYIGNNSGTKLVSDNIVFNQAGFGIHSFSASDSSAQNGLVIDGNIVFNNGSLTPDNQPSMNIILGGVAGVPAEEIRLASNYVYAPLLNASNKNQGIQVGYADKNNKNIQLIDNYIVSLIALRVYWWQAVECHGNTIYTQGTGIDLKVPRDGQASAYNWDNNTYISRMSHAPSFDLGKNNGVSFQFWRRLTGLDMNSINIECRSQRALGTKVFIRRNKYEEGRGHIAVFNWGLRNSIDVDVSSILAVGDSYKVLDAQNYFGAPVVSGVYQGRVIRIPLNLSQVAIPVGDVERMPAHTPPEFAAFVIQRP